MSMLIDLCTNERLNARFNILRQAGYFASIDREAQAVYAHVPCEMLDGSVMYEETDVTDWTIAEIKDYLEV